MKKQLLFATLILIALPCLAVASREGGLVTPYVQGGGPSSILHGLNESSPLPTNLELPIVLTSDIDASPAQFVLPSALQPLRLTLETTFAENPIDGVLFSIGEKLYGFQKAQESSHLVQLDLATGEILSREPVEYPDSDGEISLYISKDKSGELTLGTEPVRGLVKPEPWRRLTQRDLVAFPPATGFATITDLAYLDPSELLRNDLISEIPDSQIARQVEQRIQTPITLQLIVRPIVAASENEMLGKQSDMRNPPSAIDVSSESVAHLRTRELTVFNVSP